VIFEGNVYAHVYLSPHLDDVALSCGGRIWQQARAGERVLVVTVFAGAPGPGAALSPFARKLHARWGSQANAVARRREEDRAALAILGAEGVRWPYADCVYRQISDGSFPYSSEEALWGEVHPAEEQMMKELTARLAALSLARSDALYAPLAVGHHVDHQVVRRMVEASRCTTIYYEDFPYAEDRQEREFALEERRWRRDLVPLSSEALEAKVAAIGCYRSQISTFWAGREEMAAQVRAFAERTGGGRPAERYWRPARW